MNKFYFSQTKKKKMDTQCLHDTLCFERQVVRGQLADGVSEGVRPRKGAGFPPVVGAGKPAFADTFQALVGL